MSIKFSFKLIATVLSVLLMPSCFNTSKKTSVDKFYTEKGEWDSARLPLIKPYEAIITSKESGWFVNLDGIDGDTGFQHVKKLAVSNGVLFVYAVNSIFHGVNVKESWHVIVPSKHIERGFVTYNDYKKFLNQLGIKTEPKLHSIDAVARYYEYHDVIDWNAVGY